MKKIISIISIIAIIAVLSFALPSQIYAAWWNPFSWFSQNKQIEEQKQPQSATSSNTAPESQTASQNIGEAEQQNAPAPLNNIQSSDAKTIKDLKADIVLLTNGMSELLKAHNNLVNEHNTLSKYVKATISTNNNVEAITNNSNLETSVTNLEKKLNDVCAQIFSSLGGLSTNKCPSSQFLIKETLEYRIKKLEGGY